MLFGGCCRDNHPRCLRVRKIGPDEVRTHERDARHGTDRVLDRDIRIRSTRFQVGDDLADFVLEDRPVLAGVASAYALHFRALPIRRARTLLRNSTTGRINSFYESFANP